MAEKRNTYQVFVGTLEGKRPLGRPRCRCEDNTKVDLKANKWGGMDWIHLVQYPIRNMLMSLQVS
jgi:hypothetical protein